MPETQVKAYLDNSATTHPCAQAVQATVDAMETHYFNPSALYAPAVEMERALAEARRVIAASVQAEPDRVLFTSGGTESDNMAIYGALRGLRQPGEVLFSAAEHPAVRNACLDAATLYGHTAREIPIDARGGVDLAALETMLNPAVRLICVMQVSNETGAIQPIAEIAALRDRLAPEAALHVDGVQGYLRVPFSLRTSGVQSYAISGHKVHGPKGVGALVLREGYRLPPLLVGGGQQNNLRSGTENTPGILGLAAAVKAYPAPAQAQPQLAALRRRAIEVLTTEVPLLRVLGPEADAPDAAPHILYVALPPVRAETLVHALEAQGVLVGTGSACSSHKRKGSDTLAAMRVPPSLRDSAIRLSFSIQNTADEVEFALEQIIRQYRLLAPFTRR